MRKRLRIIRQFLDIIRVTVTIICPAMETPPVVDECFGKGIPQNETDAIFDSFSDSTIRGLS